MSQLARDERVTLGLTLFQPLDPYGLAAEYGVPIYCLGQLADHAPEAAAYFGGTGSSRWSAALVPIGSARIIIENDTHQPERRRSSLGHELSHHLLEHPFSELLLADDGCRRFDTTLEKQATFLAGQLLVPDEAAKKAAFGGWTNEQVAAKFGVSTQFAQMRMAGPRVMAQRALRRQAAIRTP